MAELAPGEVISRQSLARELTEIDNLYNETLKKTILGSNRLDILAQELLGLRLEPFHRAMQRHILRHPHSLQLAFRGGGKTTTVTVTYAIFRILKDPNIRILIASKTHKFAKDILKEIKAHLEGNKALIDVFGEVKGDRWDQTQIEVQGRDRPMKEPTVMTVGAEGQVVGMHYDLILCDDLVDESNARTRHMRELLQTFFYKTLMPTLEPDGELHILGTRYHYDDLYGHLSESDMKGSTQVIKALDERGRSPWPSKYPAEHFEALKLKLGSIAFGSQYECDTEAMKGEVFEYDWCLPCSLSDVPPDAKRFVGVDLAISEKDSADCFAMVAIAVDGKDVYVLKHYEGHLTFGQQVKKIETWYDEIDPITVAIESVAYQAALSQHLKQVRPDMRVKRIYTKTDKMTRAWKLAQKFEAEEVRFVRGQGRLVDHLVAFPGGRYKDLFDALDMAVTAAYKRRGRKKRENEIGLL